MPRNVRNLAAKPRPIPPYFPVCGLDAERALGHKARAMTDAPKHAPRVFSGMQPTSTLHLGNYLGALKNWVKLQETMPCIYCVVDMHAITVWQDPAVLARSIREVTAAYIAAGVDPERSILFPQSQVAAHAELAWVFNCVARLGWLNRMTQFKDKAGKNRENASVGLYVYPNLMAADILAYRATHVPVGEDQKQHLELARDIAQKFNTDFGAPDFFPLPEPIITGPGMRVMSLRDGTKKMSKSDESDYSRINLTDDADAIAQKVRKARTDPDPLPETLDELKSRAEAENLVNIYAALADHTPAMVVDEFAGAQFSVFKNALADLAVAKLTPVAREMRKLLDDPAEIDRVLKSGAERATALAAPVMVEVRRLVGFLG
jgi:tryptophanyl-tRNA synthetase